MALAALHGVRSPKLERATATARAFLEQCRSADELNWLRLGLLAQGRMPESFRPTISVAYRTVPEAALALVIDSGRELLLG
jgi:hypothetical protein